MHWLALLCVISCVALVRGQGDTLPVCTQDDNGITVSELEIDGSGRPQIAQLGPQGDVRRRMHRLWDGQLDSSHHLEFIGSSIWFAHFPFSSLIAAHLAHKALSSWPHLPLPS